MKLGGYITLLASLAGISAFAARQDPTFESPSFTPLLLPDHQETVGLLFQATVSQAATQKRVSVSFERAPVRDVIDWLTKQGVSFMMTDTQIPTDKRISINVVNQPLEDVLNALASSLGGRWERRGNILVFRSGGTLPGGLSGWPEPNPFREKTQDVFSGTRTVPGQSTTRSGSRSNPGVDHGGERTGTGGLMTTKDWEEFNRSLSSLLEPTSTGRRRRRSTPSGGRCSTRPR
jgi:hypothetical protein